MTVDDALLSRRSVRAFLPDAVPRATVEEILRIAARAPSGQNTQPWKVYAVDGAVRERLCAAVLARRENRPWPAREYPGQPRDLPDIFRQRRRENGIALYQLLGIGKDDREAADAQQRRNYLFFGAPVGLFVFIHKALSIGSWVDTSMFQSPSRPTSAFNENDAEGSRPCQAVLINGLRPHPEAQSQVAAEVFGQG